MSATLSTPKTTSGGEIIRELVNASDGAGLHFDGAAGNIDIASPPDLGTSFSFEFILQADSWADSADKYLVDFGTGGRFVFGTEDAAGAKLGIYDNSSWKTFGVAPLDDLKVHHLVATIDGTAAILYDNGNQVATVTISASHGIDSCTDARIAGIYNSTGNFNGTIYRARFWNKTLTAAEVTASYENATVPFADQYGSQTSKILNGTAWTGATGTTAPNSWTTGSQGTYTIDSSSGSGSEPALKIARNSDNPYIHQNFTAVIGAKYRISYKVKNIDATQANVGIGSSAIGSQYYLLGYSSTNWETVNLEITATTSLISVYLQAITSTGTQAVYFDSVEIKQIGCVSDYDLAFANPTQSDQVQDRSTNLLDGTASAGVTQVTKIEAINTNKLNVGGTTPLVGIGLAAGVTPSTTLQVAATDGITVGDGNDTDQTILTVDVTGSPTLTWDESDNRFVWIHDQQIRTAIGATIDLRRTTGDTSGLLGRIMFGNNNIDASLATVSSYQDGATNAGDLRFSTQTAGGAVTERLTIDSTGAVSVPDNGELQCGDSSDLRLYHNTSDSFIKNQTGRLLLGCDGDVLFTNAAFSTPKLTLASTGLATFANGIEVNNADAAGIAQIQTGGSVTIADDASITLSTSDCNGAIVSVYGTSTGIAVLFFVTYTAIAQIISDPGNVGSATDTNDKLCMIKTTNSHALTFKNRSGLSQTFKIAQIGGKLT
jgi:hypothetical protein